MMYSEITLDIDPDSPREKMLPTTEQVSVSEAIRKAQCVRVLAPYV